MLTRLEADGFKNLSGVDVELGPFTCIAGANAAGKSNLFDAIAFLSLLASRPLADAAREVRGGTGERSGDPRDLFWNGHAAGERRMRLAAEMIVPRETEDDLGRLASASATYLRYEVELGYLPPAGRERAGRLSLLSESLRPVPAARLRFPRPALFDSAVLTERDAGAAFISTEVIDGQAMVSVRADDNSRSQPALAARTPATAVSTITDSAHATILAARREMQSWRRLHMQPAALSSPARYSDPPVMDAAGTGLPAALHRIGREDGDPGRACARVAGRLAGLSGVSVRQLAVHEDDARELLTIMLTEAGGMTLPARSLSGGTLRYLALCVLLEDPSAAGVLCLEEPENSIHPANIEALVSLLRDLAVDPDWAPGPDNPLRQVIIATHSPYVVQLVDPGDLMVTAATLHRAPDGSLAPGMLLRPFAGTWRESGTQVPAATRADLLEYLTFPPGALLTL